MSGVEFETADGTIEAAGFCDRNLNLLAHAQAIEMDLGSQCGGHGRCGKDRVRTTEPNGQPDAPSLSPLTEAERRHLSAQEIAAGWRLACQCFPEKNDLNIKVALR
jgi:ferredoxin